MLKKNKVIKLESQEDKEFWLVGDSKKKIPQKPVKPVVPKQGSVSKKPSLGTIIRKFKLPKKPVKAEKKAVGGVKKAETSEKNVHDINIDTVFDKIYVMLEERKSVSVAELSLKLGLPRAKIIELAMVFEESGKIDIEYPMFGSPKLVLKEKGELSE